MLLSRMVIWTHAVESRSHQVASSRVWSVPGSCIPLLAYKQHHIGCRRFILYTLPLVFWVSCCVAAIVWSWYYSGIEDCDGDPCDVTNPDSEPPDMRWGEQQPCTGDFADNDDCLACSDCLIAYSSLTLCKLDTSCPAQTLLKVTELASLRGRCLNSFVHLCWRQRNLCWLHWCVEPRKVEDKARTSSNDGVVEDGRLY